MSLCFGAPLNILIKINLAKPQKAIDADVQTGKSKIEVGLICFKLAIPLSHFFVSSPTNYTIVRGLLLPFTPIKFNFAICERRIGAKGNF